jgi:tRNA pseudouridine38-40 synthase
MPRYKLTIEYDGTGLCGWQIQSDKPTVQGHLEYAIAKIFGDEYKKTICAGRTDAGVHSVGQIVHIDIPKPMREYNLAQAINYHLLPITTQIVVSDAKLVDDDFNARFSAINREYFYRIINRPVRLALWQNYAWHIPEPLNVEKMQEGANLLLGTHDFTSFRSTQCQAKSPVRTLEIFDIKKMDNQEIYITTKSRSFLHHQVRNMVGTLRLIGNEKWNLSDLENAMLAKNRNACGENAPPQGLYFMKVFY